MQLLGKDCGCDTRKEILGIPGAVILAGGIAVLVIALLKGVGK